MTIIKGEHHLGGFGGGPSDDSDQGRSDYFYLFPDAANAAYAGVLNIASDDPDHPDGTDADTILRLIAVATWIEQVNSDDPANDLKLRIRLPAAYAYFGQFLNHDLSAPVGSMAVDVDQIPDPGLIGADQPPGIAKGWRADTTAEITRRIRNEHAVPLRLDSLYGEGPFGIGGRPASAEVRALYDAEGLCFVLGQTVDDSAAAALLAKFPVTREREAKDLPRRRVNGKLETLIADQRNDGKLETLIADQRNDGNLILSQMHLAFMLLHNKVVGMLQPQTPDPVACFAAARRLVTQHYHWCILHDFLPRILSQGALRDAIDSPKLFTQQNRGKVPMEFSTAAFRFGHSLISDSYDYNANFGTGPRLIMQDSATLVDLFAFTAAGNMKGHDQLPDHWVIDWNRMTTDAVENKPLTQGHSEQIDLRFAKGMMAAVPNERRPDLHSIISRNLVRGFHRRIPFGQVLAKLCGKQALGTTEIRMAMPNGLARVAGHDDEDSNAPQMRAALLSQTPAWLYFLCEAKLNGAELRGGKLVGGGERLGPVASQIIAETFVAQMGRDSGDILGAGSSAWTPQQSPLRFANDQPVATLGDVLRFAVAPA